MPSEPTMKLARLIAVALLVCAFAGCASMKDDPILGTNPWKPGDAWPLKP